MLTEVTAKVVEVALANSEFPARVVEASVAEEVALSVPMVEVPVRRPPPKESVVEVALPTNG